MTIAFIITGTIFMGAIALRFSSRVMSRQGIIRVKAHSVSDGRQG